MKITWCDEEYDCEVVSLGTDNPKNEAATPLKLTKVDGKCHHYVVVVKKQEDIGGEKVLTQPSDGNVVAMCISEIDAKLVAAAINIASNIARLVAEMHGNAMKTTDQKMREFGFDVDRITAEIDRLKKEGKSNKEVYDYMHSHMEDFLMAGKTLPKEKGEW